MTTSQAGEVKAVARAIRILEIFLEHQDSRSFSDIVRISGLPKATAHRILGTLVGHSLLQETSDGHYSLGLGLLRLCNAARHQFGLRNIALPVMNRLEERFGETVFLATLQDDMVIYVESVEPASQLRCTVSPGQTAPAHCTALGKAMLAFQSPETVERVLSRPRARFTDATIIDADAFRAELELTHRRGYAINDTEHEDDIRGVAAPIRNAHGDVVAGVAVGGPTLRVHRDQLPAMGSAVITAAELISQQLGYRHLS